MKIIISICATLAFGLAATVPYYEPISTFGESQAVAAAIESTRITNGYAAMSPEQFPHQVAVISPTTPDLVAICGGSLISASWVLTAAHCTFNRPQQNLRFGSLDRSVGGISQSSFHSIPHPLYNRDLGLNYDISLVSIPSPLTFNEAIFPVRLPSASQWNYEFVGYQSTVSGWGRTHADGSSERLLRWVHVLVISNMQCRSFFSASAVVDHVVCAMGYTDSTQGTCNGDSGGPLTVMENGLPTQIGIVSFGRANGCGTGFPTGYIRTTSFASWIYSITGIPIRT